MKFSGKPDPIPDKMQHQLERLDWVQKARVRLREDGDVLTGEAFVVPQDENDLLNRLRSAYDVANGGRLASARRQYRPRSLVRVRRFD